MAHLRAMTKSGDSIELDIGENTYGFFPGQIVHFCKSLRNGKVALIRGTNEGLLWFSVFDTVDHAMTKEALDAPVDTVSCRGKEELIRQYGWMVDDHANLHCTGQG
ncbi:hypothetical protein STCU_00278 [Strigomonas culicis]|uniref:Uncharacterized protein n=1 Tax=Strigomonas culicis TaxID=28005 RepID=S9WLZ5_9TRYP|nr:hypothetical protein STCU_03022 [Strigomonas culicis]EPY37020.1 hypothetical protein STCU_00278 [Strigomonas culicis]|eukprot:EPY32010.1 hypothetical protein STCU_03022 [Strigomonas culicis]